MFELRPYQKKIYEAIKDEPSLVILPTGSGKTFIGFKLILDRIKLGKGLFLAPSRPLVEQHFLLFKKLFPSIPSCALTGKIPREFRKSLWEKSKVIFATPQLIRNELIRGNLSLDGVSTIVFDEAHHAVGDYAYVFIAKMFDGKGMVLGLTASPGDEERLELLMKNLGLKRVIALEERELYPYLPRKKIVKVDVELEPEFYEIKRKLETCMKKIYELMKKEYEVKVPFSKLKKRDILELHKKMDPKGAVYTAALLKLHHAYELIQSQGIKQVADYFEKLMKQRGKAASLIREMGEFFELVSMVFELENELLHPKFEKVKEIIEREKGKFIVFTQYRSTAELLKKFLNDAGIKAEKFVGQKEMGQSRQLEIIRRFEAGEFDVLIATSIGEEGLHIPSCDVGIFFEPVPSALRSIQRRGRVGRTKFGKIYVLVAKGTMDEAIYWSAYHKERRMKEAIRKWSR